ncbi:hypothetical protein Pmani_019307 [Petrolisthes manimaculis]|uniref:Uncharacterized protein n=1 Tax=Petrolisthes manimaculis TaxID=1843537 RepID=A0AAE1U3N7_9EUCA|nr:hypothetical protein Pmani_019307 [Petrolisthes manimaculis]
MTGVNEMCDHCTYRSAKEYNWQNRAVILAADYASTGIYNFVIPLRAHFSSGVALAAVRAAIPASTNVLVEALQVEWRPGSRPFCHGRQ